MLDAPAQETLRGSKTADFVGEHVHQLRLDVWSPLAKGLLRWFQTPHRGSIREHMWERLPGAIPGDKIAEASEHERTVSRDCLGS